MKPKTLSQKISGKIAEYAALSLLVGSQAFAQGGSHVGGGNITEADLQSYMNKIDTYLLSEEGLTAFPEIGQYNASHPNQSFHELIQSIRPVVKNTELKDSFGEVRDCVSYANPGNRYFVCNSSALPEKTLNNQPSFYRIVFHELLIQAGLEKPISSVIPSEYPISSRITDNVHLETYQEWVPGKIKSVPADVKSLGFKCQSDGVIFRRSGKSKGLIMNPNGEFWFYEFSFTISNERMGKLNIDSLTVLDSGKISYVPGGAHSNLLGQAGNFMGSYPDFSITSRASENYINQQIQTHKENPDLNVDATFDVDIYTNRIRKQKQNTVMGFTYDDLADSYDRMICQTERGIALNSDAVQARKLLAEKTAKTKFPYLDQGTK